VQSALLFVGDCLGDAFNDVAHGLLVQTSEQKPCAWTRSSTTTWVMCARCGRRLASKQDPGIRGRGSREVRAGLPLLRTTRRAIPQRRAGEDGRRSKLRHLPAARRHPRHYAMERLRLVFVGAQSFPSALLSCHTSSARGQVIWLIRQQTESFCWRSLMTARRFLELISLVTSGMHARWTTALKFGSPRATAWSRTAD
jgi:hypothetical protein